MKTLRKVPMELVKVEFIPEKLEFGKFYYSEKYKTSSHICPCGCEEIFPIPIKNNEWNILNEINLTIQPSLLHRIKCQAHYVITNGYANILREGLDKSMWYLQFGHDAQPGE